MARSIWEGVVSFGMVSIPIGISTARTSKDLAFHQIHQVCGSRIKLQKFCPVCQRVVERDELVKGYEYSKGHYTLLSDEDFEDLPVASKKTVDVLAFVKAEEVDPLFFESAYYLEPSERGKKSFLLLLRALEEKKMTALAKIALRNKESLCLLRPGPETLILSTLYYPDEIRSPVSLGADKIQIDEREMKMALDLIDLLTESFDPSQYHDAYREALLKRIEAKAEGGQIEKAPEIPEETTVYNLMDALKASVEAAQKKAKKA